MSQYDPTVTPVADEPLVVTPDERAKAFWLLRRYTSLTYLKRMSVLIANFVGGYEDFARAEKTRVGFHRENLASFYAYRAAFKKGLDQIEQGYPAGYRSVLEGCGLGDYLTGPRFDSGLENEEIGFQLHGPPQGLYAWAAVALGMVAKVSMTLNAVWAFPLILRPTLVTTPFPAPLATEPPALNVTVRTDQQVPVTGVWRPMGLASGCANYFFVGREAPPVKRADERLDYPEFPGAGGLEPPRTEYTYVEEPAEWELLWEDHRYDRGRPPGRDEAEFLDTDTEPPPWPPTHVTRA
jgi:hypothetical protein